MQDWSRQWTRLAVIMMQLWVTWLSSIQSHKRRHCSTDVTSCESVMKRSQFLLGVRFHPWMLEKREDVDRPTASRFTPPHLHTQACEACGRRHITRPKLLTEVKSTYRTQVCSWGYYIVGALLFQCFLQNNHHGNTHPPSKLLQLGQSTLQAILIRLRIIVRALPSSPAGMCFAPRPDPEWIIKMSTGVRIQYISGILTTI